MASLLQTESISKSYGDLLLFENISLNINEGQHVGLVAPNGTGKTTLLRILAGKDNPDDGLVTRRKDLRVGYLEQDPTFKDTSLVIDEVFSPDNEIFALVRDYEMALTKEDHDALARLMPLMDLHQAWDHEVKARQILSKLRITNFRQPVGQLSGGQKKRLALAAVLIREPELLILDEPTNHLDLDMIEWLEEYIAKARCALFMVTHDRYFLDRACDSIYEMDQKSIFAYEGNYTRFIEKREERLENDKSKTEKAKNLFRKELDWIRRMPQARATKAKYRVDAFQDIKEEASKRRDDRQVQINFQSSRLGNKILEIKDLSKSFDKLKILDKFSYIFSRFEKVGVVGENGSGKSTFLNLITGEIPADKGIIELGETVVLGYYRQEGIQFREDQKVIEAVTDIAEVVTLGDGSKMGASQFLNFFLFPPETQHAYISRLSGGERRRLYLVTILMKNPNFLILDEPTNDLDIMTLNVLEEFLAGFSGCVIIVSHDRFFMDKVVDHLFIFNGGGNVKDFPGNYSDYREYYRQLETQKNKEQKASLPKERTVEKNKPVRLTYKEKKEYEDLGHQIEKMEEEKTSIENELATGLLSNNEVIERSNRHEVLQKEIESLTDRWLELSERE